MIKFARNQLAPLLDKLLNADGTIPSVKHQAEIKEGLRNLYFDTFTITDQEVVSSEDEEFPHLLEHIGQTYSWGPQPSIHRRVHAEWLVLLSGAEMWNLVRGCSRVLQDFSPFYHTK